MATVNQNDKFLNYEGLQEVFALIKEQYASTEYVQGELAKKLNSSALDSYAKTEYVDEQLETKASKSYVDSEIANAVDGVAKESWVEAKGYATTSEVNEKLEGYVTKPEIEGFIDDVKYENEVITFYHGETEIATVECGDFIIDGMIKDVVLEGTDLKITFNTENGGEKEISVSLADIFDPDNYYQSSEVDKLLAKKLDTATYNVDKETFETKTHAEETYAKKDEIPSLDDYASKEWVENKGYLTEHQSLSDYAKKTDVSESIANLQENIEEYYATKAYVTKKIAEIIFPEDGETPEFSLDGYAEETWVEGKLANLKSEILGGAGEDYDTLKEIEKWIGEHEDVYQALLQTLGTKADADSVYTKEEVYSKEEIDEIVEQANEDFLTKDDAEETYVQKTDAEETYVQKTDALTADEIKAAFDAAMGED